MNKHKIRRWKKYVKFVLNASYSVHTLVALVYISRCMAHIHSIWKNTYWFTLLSMLFDLYVSESFFPHLCCCVTSLQTNINFAFRFKLTRNEIRIHLFICALYTAHIEITSCIAYVSLNFALDFFVVPAVSFSVAVVSTFDICACKRIDRAFFSQPVFGECEFDSVSLATKEMAILI